MFRIPERVALGIEAGGREERTAIVGIGNGLPGMFENEVVQHPVAALALDANEARIDGRPKGLVKAKRQRRDVNEPNSSGTHAVHGTEWLRGWTFGGKSVLSGHGGRNQWRDRADHVPQPGQRLLRAARAGRRAPRHRHRRRPPAAGRRRRVRERDRRLDHRPHARPPVQGRRNQDHAAAHRRGHHEVPRLRAGQGDRPAATRSGSWRCSASRRST